jgi:hypothetical protein
VRDDKALSDAPVACRREYRDIVAHRIEGKFGAKPHCASDGASPSANPKEIGVRGPEKTDRPWRLVAGTVSDTELRLATLSVDRVTAARIDRVNREYSRAFLGNELLQSGDAPIKGRFSWACITGELDRNKGPLVRPDQDHARPQMWANKWLSQALHILNTTAKGGIVAEEDAFARHDEGRGKMSRNPIRSCGQRRGRCPVATRRSCRSRGGAQSHVDLMRPIESRN